MGESFEIGRFTRDLFNLKDLWDCVMHGTLGLQFAVGDKYHQQVPIPWNGGLREIQTDSDLMDVLALFEQNNVNKIHFNVEYISVNVVMPSDSDDQSSYNDRDMDDGNVMDDDNELDGLSDVNEDNISQEVVLENGSGSEGEIDQPNRGTTFTLGEDGRIKLEVDQLFKNATHFRQILLEYSIQEGFRIKRIRNERKRITNGCKVKGCQLRVHGSPTYDGITYMLKTLKPKRDCLSVVKNKDITARWLGKRFETLIKDNPDMNIRVLASIVLRNIRVYVPDHTLYRAKRFALKIGDKDHKESYNKIYRYAASLLKGIQEYWTVHAFDTITKTNHNTNNVVEAFNGWLNKYRAQPLLTMMENHDMACITRMRQNVEDYVHEYLKKPAYLKTFPMPYMQFLMKVYGMRLNMELFATTEEEEIWCSKCQEVGHNSRTCKAPVQGSRTEVIWFSSSQEGTSSQGHAGNAHLTSQNLMLNAPQ
ncbi:hypothetical protein EZV62_004536 [Acer yangbiense]|uniref:Transposase MuDR plant domain-containing protein n=1 Tax=Acer yangbiense TaxID=1000413 RepID=A0A5C7IK71_9ROSI|nr:hypothetical protein EZV62_004536 [Acer yangbiense]